MWRRLAGRDELGWVRDVVCGLLSDCEPETVVSVLMFVDELCVGAFELGAEPVTVCFLRAGDPHYLRLDVSAAELLTPHRPGFVRGEGQDSSAWGIIREEHGMTAWAYLALPAPGRAGGRWSRLLTAEPRDPSLN
ncbi:hypothetical protein ORV05_19360 [Amycolatopsis cynarae]|uniref:ATP-binding protein n=1 Tax=Amycolatopsis cynarae TaxID=2995223 RepID=A0ABY7ATA0_9PSEU|nr:hypothetical protein [Amycolatopsis sp. HUAS 11-8]WAL63190.1 hypothetical protein ORV05_19360 [Amycolatopsis sp. HUAS 11-8]